MPSPNPFVGLPCPCTFAMQYLPKIVLGVWVRRNTWESARASPVPWWIAARCPPASQASRDLLDSFGVKTKKNLPKWMKGALLKPNKKGCLNGECSSEIGFLVLCPPTILRVFPYMVSTGPVWPPLNPCTPRPAPNTSQQCARGKGALDRST